MIDLEKSEKLPPEKRYFNISILWILYFRHVIRLLYYLRVPHEAVTLLSILFGLVSAGLFYCEALLMAAVALHLKDIFDAADGALARLTGRGHLIGRYLDSLGDFLALTAVMGAIAMRAFMQGGYEYVFWGAAAILSTFIQCSFFNYYQLAYLEAFGIDRLSSRRDEKTRGDVHDGTHTCAGRALLSVLRFLYIIIYSWQDRLIARIDQSLVGPRALSDKERFGNKTLMTMQSALCFGTHIFIIIIFALIGKPEAALIFIAVIMNLYLILLLYLRNRHYRWCRADSAQCRDADDTLIRS